MPRLIRFKERVVQNRVKFCRILCRCLWYIGHGCAGLGGCNRPPDRPWAPATCPDLLQLLIRACCALEGACMLILTCPYCGVACDETELSAGGEPIEARRPRRFGRGVRRLPVPAREPEGRSLRTLAPRLWLRQVVPRGAPHGDAGSVWHVPRTGYRAARRHSGEDHHEVSRLELEGPLMSHRLKRGGRLIDREQPQTFTFNGESYRGFAGDTLASALLANGQTLVGRSFKYHRPRGIVTRGRKSRTRWLASAPIARSSPMPGRRQPSCSTG